MQLTINDLSKTYSNGVHALKNVSLTINQGMFGLLGPNGAGKSSLMRTIATLQDADSGSITLDDLDVLARHPVAIPCHDQATQLGRVAGPVVLDSAGHRRRCLAGADDDEPTATEILRARQVGRDAA